jgi:excisionase family DNA binding protein
MDIENEMNEANRLTTAEVARLFNVSPTTIRRWAQLGKLRAVRYSPHGPLEFERREVAAVYLDRSIRRYLKKAPPE